MTDDVHAHARRRGSQEPPEDNFEDFKDYYNLLEITINDDVDVIKQSYRKLILDWHPDKRPDSPTRGGGGKMFTMLNDAWDTLKD